MQKRQIMKIHDQYYIFYLINICIKPISKNMDLGHLQRRKFDEFSIVKLSSPILCVKFLKWHATSERAFAKATRWT